MKIKEFNSKNIKLFVAAVEIAMKKVATEHGLSVQKKSSTFSTNSFVPKFNFSTINTETGVVNTPEAQAFEWLKDSYELGDYNLGDSITMGGDVEYSFYGIKSKSPVYPILMKSSKDGQIYKFSVKDIKRNIELQKFRAKASA